MIINPNGPEDSDIIWSLTPHSMIRRLLPVVRTDSLLASYVNEHWGTKITAARIAEIRAQQPPRKHGHTGDDEPIGFDGGADKKKAVQGSQRLLEAIQARHPEVCAR